MNDTEVALLFVGLTAICCLLFIANIERSRRLFATKTRRLKDQHQLAQRAAYDDSFWFDTESHAISCHDADCDSSCDCAND
jgi:hypothetical protein